MIPVLTSHSVWKVDNVGGPMATQDQPGREKPVREAAFNEDISDEEGITFDSEGSESAPVSGAEAGDITYDEQFYSARPKALRPVVRRRQFFAARPSLEFDGRNAAYIEWLRNQAMLGDANVLARQLSGQASMWQNSYQTNTVGFGRELEFAALGSALEAARKLPAEVYVALNLSPETCLDPRLPCSSSARTCRWTGLSWN